MKELIRALLIFLVLSLMTGLAYPLVITGLAAAFLPGEGRGQPGRGPRASRRLRPHRAKVHGGPLLPRPAVGERLRREQLRGHELRAGQRAIY